MASLRCPYCGANVSLDSPIPRDVLVRLGARLFCDSCFARLWSLRKALTHLEAVTTAAPGAR
jgi:hypothetical protein